MIILKHTKTELQVKHEGKILTYWIWGDGLIPIDKNPKIEDFVDVKRYYKTEVLGLKRDRLTGEYY